MTPILLDAGPSRCGWRRLRLSAGRSTLVDAIDFAWLSQWKWSYGEPGAHRKARKGEPGYPGTTILLHRQIMGVSYGDRIQIDHVNGNRLDNRRANLRFASPQQNGANMRRRKSNRSGTKGVVWDAARGCWAAFIKVNYKSIGLGRFKSKEDAARAYAAAARIHFGRFARLA